MTEKLYDQDAYAVEFDAKVISCEAYQEKKESGYHVILDRTLFFPEEGGHVFFGSRRTVDLNETYAIGTIIFISIEAIVFLIRLSDTVC